MNAFCWNCDKVVECELKNRNIQTSYGYVKDVIVDVCNKCGSICSIPHSSTPKIHEFIKQKRKQ